MKGFHNQMLLADSHCSPQSPIVMISIFMRTISIIIIIFAAINFFSTVIVVAQDKQKSHGFNSSNYILRLTKKDYENLSIYPILKESYDILRNSYDDFIRLSEIDKKLTYILKKYKKEMELVPIKKVFGSAQKNNFISFSAFGYNIQLPWKDHDETYRTDPASCIVKFNQWLVAIEDPSGGTGSLAYETWKYELLDSIFNNDPPNNLYDFVKIILCTSYNDLQNEQNLLKSVRQKSLLTTLLIVKRLYIHENPEQGIYADSIFSFDLPNIKGFQIGRPSTSNQTILILFPNNDTELTIRIIKGKKGAVTQNHVDYIIRNFELGIKTKS